MAMSQFHRLLDLASERLMLPSTCDIRTNNDVVNALFYPIHETTTTASSGPSVTKNSRCRHKAVTPNL